VQVDSGVENKQALGWQTDMQTGKAGQTDKKEEIIKSSSDRDASSRMTIDLRNKMGCNAYQGERCAAGVCRSGSISVRLFLGSVVIPPNWEWGKL
jgi:hypothetical protein